LEQNQAIGALLPLSCGTTGVEQTSGVSSGNQYTGKYES
jgi:hypothetical protein